MNNYVARRNTLIPLAERHADSVASKEMNKDGEWDRAFHKEMNRLAKEIGLTKN